MTGTMQTAIKDDGSLDYGQQATNQRLCLWNWSTKLAPADGSIREVAEAVVTACDEAVNMAAEAWAQRQQTAHKLTERPAVNYEGQRSEARRTAMFYVAASRAGNCKPVKASTRP